MDIKTFLLIITIINALNVFFLENKYVSVFLIVAYLYVIFKIWKGNRYER